MKKILTLSIVLAISTTMSFAASEYGNALKKAIRQDIETTKKEAKDYNASVKNAIKKDIEAKKAANENAKTKALQEKKTTKLNEINAKITELNKEKASIQANKNITYTEKTLKIKAIDKQLEYYNKQKNALK